MPYKHIAAHLQKTELACRLHYHQLSLGTKRRRRNSSISSARSACSSSTTYESNLTTQRSLPTISPPTSPEGIISGSAVTQSPHNPIPILPKLVAKPQQALYASDSLHVVTHNVERFDERLRINRDRLGRIYEAHRAHFWSTIARDYGDNVSASLLEDVWCRECASSSSAYPPTPPTRSPRSTQATPATLGLAFAEAKPDRDFSPRNISRSTGSAPTVPTRGSFAISSLLTEDREVRNPGRKALEI